MKLNHTQIDQLYGFTRQHFVEHYDLQTELVDHLANGIEERWEEQPNCSFEEALQLEFKKFGVFGFADVITNKQNALTKTYWKIIARLIKDWFSFPKLLLTTLLFLSCYFLLDSDFGREFLEVSLIVIAALTLLLFAYNFNKHKKKRANKKWLLEEIIVNTGGFVSLSFIPLQTFTIFLDEAIVLNQYPFITFIAAFSLTIILLLTYIIFKIIPDKAEEFLLDAYPEYKFEK